VLSVIVILSQEGLGCCASPYTSNRICDWLRRYGWEVVNLTVHISRLVDVHLFEPLKKHLAGKRLTTRRVKQAVSPCWSLISSTPVVNSGTNSRTSMVNTWRSNVYHLLHMSYKDVSVAEYFFRHQGVCCSVVSTLKSLKILDLLSSCREPHL